jgi:hypothetical protein
MNRLIQKIAVITLTCLLALNIAASATVDAAPCPPHLCCGGLMDLGHHNGMINFALPLQGCGEDCNDIYCDLMKDPLQDVNAVNSSPFQGHHSPVVLGTVNASGQSGLRASVSESRNPLIDSGSSSQIPLYLENLALII